MIFDLVRDFATFLTAMPLEHPRRRTFSLLDEAIRRDVRFIDRHPTTLFQCLWNNCWWYDCPEAKNHYVEPEGGWKPGTMPWNRAGPKLSALLEVWRRQKQAQRGFAWLRSLRPPNESLNSPQLAVIRGHKSAVNSVAFSPDGQRIVSGSNDDTVRVWDAAGGQELLTLRGHERGVNSVVFSPNGQRIASGSDDDTVRIWDAVSGQELACIRGHERGVNSVVFSPNGQRIASGSDDDTVRVWDAVSGQELACIRGHERGVNSVVFSPDGRRIASGSDDGTVRVWDATSGQQLTCIRHQTIVNSVSFSPDSQRIISGSGLDLGVLDYAVRVWDVAGGQQLACLRGHEDRVSSVSFSPDGRRIVSGAGGFQEDHTVRVWDVAKCQQHARLRGHEGLVGRLSFSPDGRQIASGSADKTVRVWDVASGQEIACLRGHKDGVVGLSFSRDGRRILSADENLALVWDAETGQCLETRQGIQVTGSHSSDEVPHSFRAYRGILETVIEKATTEQILAWFPVAFDKTNPSPTGPIWAGCNGIHVYLFSLEGDQELMHMKDSDSRPAASGASRSKAQGPTPLVGSPIYFENERIALYTSTYPNGRLAVYGMCDNGERWDVLSVNLPALALEDGEFFVPAEGEESWVEVCRKSVIFEDTGKRVQDGAYEVWRIAADTAPRQMKDFDSQEDIPF